MKLFGLQLAVVAGFIAGLSAARGVPAFSVTGFLDVCLYAIAIRIVHLESSATSERKQP